MGFNSAFKGLIAVYSICGNATKYVRRPTQVKRTLDSGLKILQCQTKTVEVTSITSSFTEEDSVEFLKPSDVSAFSKSVGVLSSVGRRMQFLYRKHSPTFFYRGKSS